MTNSVVRSAKCKKKVNKQNSVKEGKKNLVKIIKSEERTNYSTKLVLIIYFKAKLSSHVWSDQNRI